MTTDIATQIDLALSDPASASSDGQSVTSRSASDQIALLQFGAAAAAAGLRRRGVRYSKASTAPALSDNSYAGARSFSGGWQI